MWTGQSDCTCRPANRTSRSWQQPLVYNNRWRQVSNQFYQTQSCTHTHIHTCTHSMKKLYLHKDANELRVLLLFSWYWAIYFQVSRFTARKYKLVFTGRICSNRASRQRADAAILILSNKIIMSNEVVFIITSLNLTKNIIFNHFEYYCMVVLDKSTPHSSQVEEHDFPCDIFYVLK